MATVKEVAARAEVSVGTVSNVLSGAARVSRARRERVLAAIRELGYQPNHIARSLKLRQTMTLGMIVSDITNPFFSQLVRGAEEAALEANYLLLTFNTDDRVDREKQVLAVLRARRVDGILLVVAPAPNSDYAHVNETIEMRTPVVCLDRVPPGIKVDSVTVDNVAAARRCVQHLLERGHRRIGIITGSPLLETARQRLQGYRKALAEAGIPFDAGLVRQGDFRARSGYQLGRELLASTRRPTAVFVSNGLMAIGVLKAVEELGLQCPRDVAIATFDDMPWAEGFRPHLTTVAQPAYEMGYRGAKLLMQRIASRETAAPPVKIRLHAELKIAESTSLALRAKGLRHTPRT
jgi:LacI family transcriptional regulator